MEPLFDVVAVNILTGAERFIANNKTERNAEAIVSIAVMRRGIEEEFFKTVPAIQRPYMQPRSIKYGRGSEK